MSMESPSLTPLDRRDHDNMIRRGLTRKGPAVTSSRTPLPAGAVSDRQKKSRGTDALLDGPQRFNLWQQELPDVARRMCSKRRS